MKQYQSLLDEVNRQQARYGEQMQPPASAQQITALQREAQKKLTADVPEEYLDFLRQTNGLVWENLIIYASQKSEIANQADSFIEGFVEENLAARDVEECKDLLIFGSSGNVDLYVKRISENQYQILDYTSLSVTKNVVNFDALVTEALQIRLQPA
jgi:hypothetical protein